MQIVSKELAMEILEVMNNENSEIVEVTPDYGFKVVALTAEGALEIITKTNEDSEAAMFVWVAASVVDENNSPMFSAEEVKKLPNKIFGELSRVTMKLNGLLVEDSVEDAEKNSEEVES